MTLSCVLICSCGRRLSLESVGVACVRVTLVLGLLTDASGAISLSAKNKMKELKPRDPPYSCKHF